MRTALAANHAPVLNVRLSGKAGVTDKDAMIAYAAVVSHVDIGHYKGIASNLGKSLSAGLGAAVYGGALADVHAVSNLHPGVLSLKLEVLRDGSHYCSGKHSAVFTHAYMAVNGGTVEDFAAVAYDDVIVYKGKGAYFYILSQFSAGIHAGEGVDLRHIINIRFIAMP
jgi:hypothetical protein